MATSKSGYDKLLEQSEPIHPDSVELRLEVRQITEDYSTKYTTGDDSKEKYFVVDTDTEEILFESDWDVPTDPGTDGQRKRAIAFRSGYKQRIDDEPEPAPTAGQPVGSNVADEVDSAGGCNQ